MYYRSLLFAILAEKKLNMDLSGEVPLLSKFLSSGSSKSSHSKSKAKHVNFKSKTGQLKAKHGLLKSKAASKTSKSGKSGPKPKAGKSGPKAGSSLKASAGKLAPKVIPKGPTVVKKRDDAVYDLEQQFILRLPPGPSMALRHDVQSAAMNLKDRLSIELHSDMRHGKVVYGGQVFNSKLVDLPTIIECLKTTDRKSYYKTADICQMMVCNMDDESDSPDEVDLTKGKKDKDKKYQYNHGLTPPLKNVRKRRFRKTLKKKYQEQPDIEKEVKRLFRMDNEAIDVKWEVVIEEEKQQNSAETPEKQVLAQGGTTIGNMGSRVGADGSVGLLDLEEDIFGEVSSSEEEEDEKELNVMDSGEDEAGEGMSRVDTAASDLTHLSLGGDTNLSAEGDSSELQAKLQELSEALKDIQERKIAAELDMAVTDDMNVKEQMQDELNALMEEENKVENEFQILSSMLNQ